MSEPTEAALTGLMFLGFVGLADPPAPGVKETIARLRQAGLRTVMLTGDQRLTARGDRPRARARRRRPNRPRRP